MTDSCLTSLPSELLHSILDYLHDSSHTLRAVALTNGRLSAIARPLTHHRKTIVLASSLPRMLTIWLQNPYIKSGTRDLIVISARLTQKNTIPVEEASCKSLVAFILALSKLESMTWNAFELMPIAVLDAIHHHSHARLSVTKFLQHHPTGEDPPSADGALALEHALSISPALTSYGLFVLLLQEQEAADWGFQNIVMHAPNLRNVEYTSYQYGCVSYGLNTDQWREERLNALPTCGPSISVQSLELNYLVGLEIWERIIRLDQVKRFVLKPPVALLPQRIRLLLEKLSGVEDLSLHLYGRSRSNSEIADNRDTINSALTMIPPLVSLRLDKWRDFVDLPQVLACHGQTLTKLELHTVQDERRSYDFKHMISYSELKTIKELCPYVKDLGVDFERPSTEPKLSDYDDMLDCIASMNIKRLCVCLDSTNYSTDTLGGLSMLLEDTRVVQPSTTEALTTFVLALWTRIFAHVDPSGVRIVHELEVISGNERPNPFTYANPGSGLWNSTRWVARSHERDDRPGECELVVAPNLRKDWHKRWEQQDDDGVKESKLKRLGLRFGKILRVK